MADLSRHARKALGARLRETRRDAGFRRQGDLAALLSGNWDQPKVSRIENGEQIPTEDELVAWCAETGADLEELTEMRERATAEYTTFGNRFTQRGGAPGLQEAIAAAEAGAARIGFYQPAMVPGILQTAGYAREMLHLDGGPLVHGASEDDLNRMIATRLRRQAILHEPGRRISVVLNEAALRIQVASHGTMRAQCEHIAQLASSLTTATIGVVPFAAQVPVATLTGWFILDDLVTVETEGGDLEIGDPLEVERYWRYTGSLMAVAAKGSEAAALCQRVAAEYAG